MKKNSIVVLIISLLIAFSCTQKKQKKAEESCISDIQEVQKTFKLAVGDSLKSFVGGTIKGQYFSIYEMKGNFTLLYFTKLIIDKQGHISRMHHLNEEIENKSLWESVKNKNGNIFILNFPKVANSYGVELAEGYKVIRNTLFVADKNKIITHIYIDLCEDDIINIVNRL